MCPIYGRIYCIWLYARDIHSYTCHCPQVPFSFWLLTLDGGRLYGMLMWLSSLLIIIIKSWNFAISIWLNTFQKFTVDCRRTKTPSTSQFINRPLILYIALGKFVHRTNYFEFPTKCLLIFHFNSPFSSDVLSQRFECLNGCATE